MRAGLVVLIAMVSGCAPTEPTDADWVVTFDAENLRERSMSVQARILTGGCDSTHVAYATVFERSGPARQQGPTPPALAPGVYGFEARARDGECMWYARGCTPVEIPMLEPLDVEVRLMRVQSDSECDTGFVCDQGECVEGGACEGQVECGGSCVDPMQDISNCGACGASCAVAANAEQACVAGRCDFTCEEGFSDCNGDPSDGCETNLSITLDDCGACGVVCELEDNVASAGCQMGRCQYNCRDGFEDCNESIEDGCEADLASAEHCGECGSECDEGLVCVEGECALTCDEGLTVCDRSCRDLTSDPAHCGECDNACVAPAHASPTCTARSCGFVCDEGFDSCDAGPSAQCATNLSSDESHCGECGNACADNEICDASACTCAWRRRRRLTIDNTGGDALSDFPLMVTLDASRIDYERTQNEGQDLRFLSADGSQSYSFEVESWDETDVSIVWVRIPEIPAGANFDFWMYYGNPLAPPASDPASVWSASFEGVWHLDESVDDGESSGRHMDSTVNARHGGQDGNNDGPGKIVFAQEFDGSDDRILLGAECLVQDAWTVEAWLRPSSPDNYERYFSQGSDACATRQLSAFWRSGHIEVYTNTMGERGESTAATGPIASSGTWSYVVWTFDGATHELYVDGEPSSGPATGFDIGVRGDSFIGARGVGNYWTGRIDEVRVHNTARNAAWIRAQSESMRDSFIAYGGPEPIGEATCPN